MPKNSGKYIENIQIIILIIADFNKNNLLMTQLPLEFFKFVIFFLGHPVPIYISDDPQPGSEGQLPTLVLPRASFPK